MINIIRIFKILIFISTETNFIVIINEMNYTPAINRLIKEFSRLPGIGTKSATNLAFAVLGYEEHEARAFSDAIKEVKNKVKLCKKCFNICEAEICDICLNIKRDQDILCIVEKITDLFSIENSGAYTGLYHVLHGRLSPVEGIGPDELKIKELVERIDKYKVKEIILATNPDVEGEATAIYLTKILEKKVHYITKLAMGLPLGAHLEYADARTLSMSFIRREKINNSL
jgi:recombination protein RecR